MSRGRNTENEVRDLIRKRLNEEKIKLWLEPYTTNDGQRGEMSSLIETLSSSLQLQRELVETVLEELRRHALTKYIAIQKFREQGIAVLKVRLTGNVPENIAGSLWTEGEQMVEIHLDSTGSAFKDKLSELSGVSAKVLRPIANGHVLEDNISLRQQRVLNFNLVLVLCLSSAEIEVVDNESRLTRVAKTRQAAEMVASYDGDDDNVYQLQIADQNGRIIDMPKEEKKALGLAMMLNEKGRAALKRKDIALSLVYLLEADEEFKKCRSSILDTVDNYALLCLDIVWCYLRLQNVSALPDAEVRLKTCEESFKKSYGTNLERLRHLKGGTGKEQALLMRLHLLQGVLAFHQGNNQICNQKLQQVESELARLQVDENSMTQVMAMGFSSTEARLGLRATAGNVEAALSHIIGQREDKKKRLMQEKEERKVKRLERTLGKTASGENVNVSFYKMLLSMGFPKGASAEALRQTNNDVQTAIDVIHQHPELLSLPDPDRAPVAITDDLIQQVVALGFDEDSVRAALHHFKANIGETIEQLVQAGGLALPEWYRSIPTSPANGNRSSNSSASEASSPDDAGEMKPEDRARLIEEEFASDIPQDEEDHLDLELEDEAAILEEYKARLASII